MYMYSDRAPGFLLCTRKLENKHIMVHYETIIYKILSHPYPCTTPCVHLFFYNYFFVSACKPFHGPCNLQLRCVTCEPTQESDMNYSWTGY